MNDYDIDCVDGKDIYGNHVVGNFVKENGVVVFATITNAEEKKCYCWTAEGHWLDFFNSESGDTTFHVKDDGVIATTPYEVVRLATVSDLMWGIDIDISEYSF